MLSTSRHYSPKDALRLVFCPHGRAGASRGSASVHMRWSHRALPSPSRCASSLAINAPCTRIEFLTSRCNYDFAQTSRRQVSTHSENPITDVAAEAPYGGRKRKPKDSIMAKRINHRKLRKQISLLRGQLDAIGGNFAVLETLNITGTTSFGELKNILQRGQAALAAVAEKVAVTENHITPGDATPKLTTTKGTLVTHTSKEEQIFKAAEAAEPTEPIEPTGKAKATSSKNDAVVPVIDGERLQTELSTITSYEVAWLLPRWRNSVRRKLKKELIKLMAELEEAGSPLVPPSYIKIVQTEDNIQVAATNRILPRKSLARLRIDDAHLRAIVNQCRRQLADAKKEAPPVAANVVGMNLPDANSEPEYVSKLMPLLDSELKVSQGKTDNKGKATSGKSKYSIGNFIRSIAASVTGPGETSDHAKRVASESGFEITVPKITDTTVDSKASAQTSSTKSATDVQSDVQYATKTTQQSKFDSWAEITADKAPESLDPGPQSPIATLAHGLDRVLFNPGIHWLQDPRSQVYNFDPYLQGIMQPDDFDYAALPPYIRPSSHSPLQQLARKYAKKYTGSTSSMSGFMSHLYFLISGWKPVNTFQLSAVFRDQPRTFTSASKAPGAIHVVKNKDLYSINAGKTGGDNDSILSLLGRSMEKMLTLPPEEIEKYRKKNSWQIPKEDRKKSEAYHYSQFGDFLLRSQLDCVDPRLPNKTFDIKTRAVIAIRLDQKNYEDNSGYALRRAHGLLESFEREYYDMTRSAFLKYSMQVRIGNMDGIIVAYHNTQRIFGFQYISLAELDERLFGSTEMGEQAFSLILGLFNGILDKVTALYPGRSVSLDFETAPVGNELVMYAEPFDKGDKAYTNRKTARLNDMLDEILRSREEKANGQEKSSGGEDIPVKKTSDADGNAEASHPDVTKIIVRTQSSLNGHAVKGAVYFPSNFGDALVNPPKWTVKYDIEATRSLDLTREKAIAMEDQMWAMRKKALKMTSLEDLLAERAARLVDRQKFIQDTAKMAEGAMEAEKKADEPKGLLKILRDISNRRKKEEKAKKLDEQPKVMWVPHSGRADEVPKQKDVV